MDRTRFDQHTPRNWRPIRPKDREFILSPGSGGSRSSQHKQFFVIVSKSTSQEGKAIRRVAIFDDNPASLRLLSKVEALDLEQGEQHRSGWIVLGCLLLIAVGLVMIWPVL